MSDAIQTPAKEYEKKTGLFELSKDISSPDGYWRAGTRKTKEQWEQIFPKAFKFSCDEWFIDLDRLHERTEVKVSEPLATVKEVFKRHELRSLSYMDAAVEACRIYARKIADGTIPPPTELEASGKKICPNCNEPAIIKPGNTMCTKCVAELYDDNK